MKRKTNGIVSRVLPDGTLIEALFDPAAGTTGLVACERGGLPRAVPHVDLPDGTRLVAYAPSNALLTSGCVLLPSRLPDVGDVGDLGDLVADVSAYLRRYLDISDGFLDLAVHYVLLSWVYDAFNELPYLRFKGRWGSGKSRSRNGAAYAASSKAHVQARTLKWRLRRRLGRLTETHSA